MDWLKNKFTQFRTKIYNRIASIAKTRAENNEKSIRSRIAGLEAGNLCIALSTTGLMALGTIPMSLTLLIILATMFIVIGIIGRYVDAVEDDVERLLKYEEHIRESADGGDANSSSTDSVQQ